MPMAARTVLYNSVGHTVTHYDLDVVEATLTMRRSLEMPSVVQYGWPHPSGRQLYLSTTNSARGSATITGSMHRLCALQISADGALSFHGQPQVLRQRPIHNSVDRGGRYVLTCYNAPPHLTVHRIQPDGSLGDMVEQGSGLDLGIFPHQILTVPSNRAATVVTRGNKATASTPADPGAVKLYRFDDGLLSPLDSIAVGHGGLEYGPRHLDFHPTRPWVYVLVELQNQLHMHRLSGDLLEHDPAFVKPATQHPVRPDVVQVAGAIHVHPRGHVLYVSNRVSATTHPIGAFPFTAGENNIAVFRIDPLTGEPSPLQYADPHGFHIRAFTIEPSGKLLIAASLTAMSMHDGVTSRTVPAGLSLFRIAEDGHLDFARRYEIELASGEQQMWVRALRLDNAKAP
jgi:6-phosphogluconolactonase (cycloisomerase 2 family)